IENGRFGDLPAGIYARAAIRSFAAAYGLDPDEVLAGCSGLLPSVEDPIDALGRARGIARAPEPAAPASSGAMVVEGRRLRTFAAATVDAAIVATLLLATSLSAALLARVSIGALSSSAISLFVVGLIFGAGYYVWMGGLSGTTFGEYAVGQAVLHRDPRPLTLRAIALRTLGAATADARAFYRMGMWIRCRLTRDAARSVPPPAPLPSPPPPPGREEALTWSANRRASVPPPPLHPRHG
ncbi:MAG TPA: helix-turn-helix domain-containing protein, partial [Vicinamibacterales bacterium]|nr:helix-turn-helix domain-containing protein [Vicinamibacterales bacterium]